MMRKREYLYCIGAFLMFLPVPLSYTSMPMWASFIILMSGILVFGYQNQENEALLRSKGYQALRITAIAAPLMFIEAVNQKHHLLLIKETAFDYGLFQIAYTAFLIALCYVKVVEVPRSKISNNDD